MSDYYIDEDNAYSSVYGDLFRNDEPSINYELPTNDESPTNNESPMNDESSMNDESIAWDYFKTEKIKEGFFDVCQLCKEKNITIKYVHNSSTGNMLGHLWSKHRINKEHPDRMNMD
ncbi:6_t:CDS:2, partial [Dentiscutata erythropus]